MLKSIIVNKNKILIYLITEDWFFNSHFFDRALAAKKEGYTIYVLCNINIFEKKCEDFIFINIKFSRKSINLLKEINVLFKIIYYYSKINPDLVHHVGIKPIIYGTFSAILLNIKKIINAPVGMGYIFSSSDLFAALLKPFIIFLFKIFLNPKNSKVIIENSDDLNYFIESNLVNKNKIFLIRGSGVNLSFFNNIKNNSSSLKIVLVARMLKDKGIMEFIEAATIINKNSILIDFILVGDVDAHNPSSISLNTLNFWNNKFGIKWLGKRNDVPAILAKANIACLPSYREGLPKFLLEAASSGLPIVASDVEGCREIVKHNFNGLLVPKKNSLALAKSLQILIDNEELRLYFGRNARFTIEKFFSNEIIIDQTMNIYNN